MENASKALLIAAAVLIVILLIAFGMRILNSAGDTAGQAGEIGASTSMQTFNAQFSAYTGRVTSSGLRNLISLVNSSNSQNPSHMVQMRMGFTVSGKTYVTGAATSAITSAVTTKPTLSAGANIDEVSTYKISFNYDATGYIIEVIVGNS